MLRDLAATIDLLPGEIVVDNFAGGGGTSTGVEAAIGRPCDIAINHDPIAITMHKANHPETRHYTEDVWAVDPKEVAAGRPVGLAWFSPDCRHFSSAKGSAPVSASVRGLAWVVVRWARAVHPRIIILENVQEFQTWGPLDGDNMPIKARAGETFREWLGELAALVVVEGETYQISDIGMRMLAPHELFAAQGFPSGYEIRPSYYGKPISKTDQTRLAGNSVCPPVARALVAANIRSAA